MISASQRTGALPEWEAKRREKARLLIQQFRAKFGAVRVKRHYRRVTPVSEAKSNHKGGIQ